MKKNNRIKNQDYMLYVKRKRNTKKRNEMNKKRKKRHLSDWPTGVCWK